MFLSIGLSLLSSRWILSALGQTDYGLYAVVAGIMGFLSFLTGAMTGSAQRHFAFAIGEGDDDSVSRWFNASCMLHIGLALLLIIIGLPFGFVMMAHVLNIPDARLAVCKSVFFLTILTVMIQVVSVPFSGMFTAKQRIYEVSVFQFTQTLLMVVFAYVLKNISGDRLLVYALGVMVIALLTSWMMIVRCRTIFKGCRVRGYREAGTFSRVKELVSFAGWNFFGALGFVGSNQGMAFLINVFSNPRINASFGIANQVTGQVAGLSQAFFNAVAPEITSSEGRGQRERVVSLSLRTCKMSVFLMSLLLIPIFFEMDHILKFWLADVPPFTSALCRIVLLAFLVDKLTIGYMVAVAAHGQIAGYQATLGGALLLAPFITWVMFVLGFGVVSAVGCGLLATRIVCSLGRVWWVRKLMQVPLKRWFWAVPVRLISPSILASMTAWGIQCFFVPSICRVALTLSMCAVIFCVTGWFFAFDEKEREYLAGLVKKCLQATRASSR